MVHLPTLIAPAQIIIALAFLISASGGAIARVILAIRWGRSPHSRLPFPRTVAELSRTQKKREIHNQLR
jgi:hypothetical protein